MFNRVSASDLKIICPETAFSKRAMFPYEKYFYFKKISLHDAGNSELI